MLCLNGTRVGRYGTRICRFCSSSGRSGRDAHGRLYGAHGYGSHSSVAGRGCEPTKRCSTGLSSSTATSPERSGPGVTPTSARSRTGSAAPTGAAIATDALDAFLRIDRTRPLHARVASDNAASRRVLEKCGFRVIATERGFAEARSAEIEELVLRLDETRRRRRSIAGSRCLRCSVVAGATPRRLTE